MRAGICNSLVLRVTSDLAVSLLAWLVCQQGCTCRCLPTLGSIMSLFFKPVRCHVLIACTGCLSNSHVHAIRTSFSLPVWCTIDAMRVSKKYICVYIRMCIYVYIYMYCVEVHVYISSRLCDCYFDKVSLQTTLCQWQDSDPRS